MPSLIALEVVVKTGELFDDPPPSIVTRLVSEAPLPVVGPRMVVFDGMFKVPLASVMVVADANFVESKVMLAEP